MNSQQLHPNTTSLMQRDQSVLELFGISVQQAHDGHCRLHAQVTEQLVNGAGFAHGALAFALLDTACAYAVASLETLGVTVNANVSYVKGSQQGDQLDAQVSVVSRSKRLLTLTGEVHNQDAQLVAHGSFMFQLLEPR